jgi:hypothetical protein
VLAKDPIAGTEWLFAGTTVLACAVAESGIYDDVVADRQFADVTADGVDHAGDIGAKDPWRNDRDARQTADDEKVEMVERGGSNSNPDVVIMDHVGNWQIRAKLDAIQSTVFRDRECLHYVACTVWGEAPLYSGQPLQLNVPE